MLLMLLASLPDSSAAENATRVFGIMEQRTLIFDSFTGEEHLNLLPLEERTLLQFVLDFSIRFAWDQIILFVPVSSGISSLHRWLVINRNEYTREYLLNNVTPVVRTHSNNLILENNVLCFSMAGALCGYHCRVFQRPRKAHHNAFDCALSSSANPDPQ